MDLLFKRYASPFSIMEQMLDAGRFEKYIDELIGIRNEEKEEDTLWDMYIHHRFLDMSFNQYKAELGINEIQKKPVKADFETTIKESISILNNFVPENR